MDGLSLNNPIARIFAGSCAPCSDLLEKVESGEIDRTEANSFVQRFYGGRVHSVSHGAEIERLVGARL